MAPDFERQGKSVVVGRFVKLGVSEEQAHEIIDNQYTIAEVLVTYPGIILMNAKK
jgi:hypothetical protein